ncbi:MAG: TonB-dependent receptor plug [Bacteroidetes bacterium]|nr:TonB-dependent receptor plug [Bacteroidota bacterium]
MRFKNILLSLCFFSSFLLQAQTDSGASATKLAEFSLEELMNIPIYSVSKSEESSFDAALSASVVTREEIKRAGCTTIMEAMRLVPGVIVREQTNGSYDIHIRGLDNVPPNLGLYFFGNSTTLVMIDDRPVYNYLHGGTFWETLPVDLNDVEKIEVVRGPSTAMYGPNAESGVINIITRRPEKKGWYAVANGQYGNYNTGIANASFGYKVKDKFSAVVSGNFQNRNRTQSDYYDPARDQFEPLDTFIKNDSVRSARYPHPDIAMRKYGYNIFLNYKINKHASIDVEGGGQHSEIQDIFASNFLTTALATSYYGNLKAQVYGADLQVSYLTGTQQPQAGLYQGKWDFNTTDITLDYHITQVKHLVITPGLSYRRAAYDDRRYVNEATREGLFNGEVVSQTYAAFLRADARFFKEKLRLIAAARMDKFNKPSKLYWSWQFAMTYKVSDKHILRIVESRANRAPLFLESYYNLSVPFNLPGQPGTIQLLGANDINLLTTDMLEIGYRGKLRDNLEIDLEVFGTSTKNFSNEIFTRIDSSATSKDYIYTFTNIPLVARQFGATISIHYIVGKFQFKPFITVQRTTLFNYSPYTVSPTAPVSVFFAPSPATQNINSGMGKQMTHIATPTVYGGAYINYAITSHLNVNITPYFMSASTQLEAANLVAKNGINGVENINPKFIMDVVASYTFFKKLTLFANFKNCFSDKTREFFRGDIPGFKVSGGISFEY